MIKISIIVPVYNVEKYLEQCLDSILSQTFTDFECICINDGSTDKSLTILEKYIKQDNRFSVIYQENKGLSSARNVGISKATGIYITFIDSDDWVTKDYLEKLYNTITSQNADIVRGNYFFYYQKEDMYQSAKIREIHRINNINSDIERLYKGYAGAFVWGKLYKTSLIKYNDIYFYEGRSSEDCPFSSLVYLYSKNICFIEDELYFYRKQVISLTSNSEKLIIDAFYNFITLTKELNRRGFDSFKIKKFCVNIFFYKIGKIGKDVSKNRQKELLKTTIEHLIYLKNFNKVKIIKINVTLLLFKSFKTKTFKIFRALKNIKF